MRTVQFKKGKKRAKAQEEAEAMYLAGANSALCIALAKMHMTLAVEQVRRRRPPPPATARPPPSRCRHLTSIDRHVAPQAGCVPLDAQHA